MNETDIKAEIKETVMWALFTLVFIGHGYAFCIIHWYVVAIAEWGGAIFWICRVVVPMIRRLVIKIQKKWKIEAD